MSFLGTIYKAFQDREPHPASVFRLLYNNDRKLNLCFVDRERLLHNIQCRVQAIKFGKLYLKPLTPLPSCVMGHEKCRIYFKLSYELLYSQLHIRQQMQHDGFFCKSNILDFGTDIETTDISRICVKMPGTCMRRELREYPRYGDCDAIYDAVLYLLPPENGEEGLLQIGKYRAKISNISGGGALVVLESSEFLEEFATVDQWRIFLGVAFKTAHGNTHHVLVPCHCVTANYSISRKCHMVRLQFFPTTSALENALFLPEDYDTCDQLQEKTKDTNLDLLLLECKDAHDKWYDSLDAISS